VRAVEAANASGLKIALFTGRRCGGMAWLLLQNAYCASAIEQPLGTSSVTAVSWLKAKGVPSLAPAGTHAHELSMVAAACYSGTHAHELSMVAAACYSHLDDIAGGTVAASCLGHALYLALTRPAGDARPPERHTRMPMLPDTLGTRAFLHSARALVVPAIAPYHSEHQNRSLLDAMGGARQDSGGIGAFKQLMDKELTRPIGLMASEIKDPADLIEARASGFSSIGAGGFFGDSTSAWKGAEGAAANGGHEISLAVKPIAVFVRGVRTREHPLKLGDTDGSLSGNKIEVDATLSPAERARALERGARLARCHEQVFDAAALAELNGAFAEVLTRIVGGALAHSTASIR